MEIQEFIEKFAETLLIDDVESLNENTEFKTLSEWSSLMIVQLVVMYDEEFGKSVSIEQIKTCDTIGQLLSLCD